MKKRVCTFLLLVLFLLSLSIGALADSSRSLPLVADSAGLLSERENGELNSLAEELSARYGCEIVVVTIAELDGWYVDDLTEAIYTQYGYGYGEEKSGVILLLSMEERDYDMAAYGYGNTAFTDYGKERLMDSVLPYLGRNDWYGGFREFITLCGDYLKAARDGAPVDAYGYSDNGYASYDPGPDLDGGEIIFAVLAGLIVAAVVAAIQRQKMKSAVLQTRADRYMDELRLTEKEDRYIRTTKTRTPRSTSSSGGSRSGGGTSVRSSGFSHHSGKF